MKKIFIVCLIAFLGGCEATSIEKELGFENKTTKEIIHLLNTDEVVRSSVSASINGTELTITKDDEVLIYDVGEYFYIAVAPYISFTHT